MYGFNENYNMDPPEYTDFEDDWEDVSYDCEFVDIYAEFKVDFVNGNWDDDWDYNPGWEKEITWMGDYNEVVTYPDLMWEEVRDAFADEVGELPDGTYIISGEADITISVDKLYRGIKRPNYGEIDDEDMETKVRKVTVRNIKIEEVK